MLKRRIPKIVIAFTCIIAILMQYTGTLFAAGLSYTDRATKFKISILHQGGEESSGTLSQEQQQIYDENSYVYFVGNVRVNKIVKDESPFEDTLYCLDASKKFPAETLTIYSNSGELSQNEKYNTNSINWLVNNMYLQYQDAESKDEFLRNAFAGSEYDLDVVKATLTDDDIDVIQQYAIWHFTNSGNPDYANLSSIRVINSRNIGSGPIDSTLAVSLSDIDRDLYAHRSEMAEHLYNYLVTNAENPASTTGPTYPELKSTDATKTVIRDGFYVAGPFEISAASITYDVKLIDQDNQEITSGYNILLADDTISTKKLNQINEPFYIQIPTSSSINSLKLKLSYNREDTKATVWEATDNTYQPVLLINKVKENVEQEQPVTVVKKGSYDLELIKQDKDSKEGLPNVKFNVQIGDGETKEYTTNGSGKLTIPTVTITERGTDIIKITEVEAATGYEKINGTIQLEVTKVEVSNQLTATGINLIQPGSGIAFAILSGGKITLTVNNEKTPEPQITGKYEIELLKQDKDSSENLAGAVFSIQVGNDSERTYATNTSGTITIPNIEIKEAGTDTIKIKETKAPTGYKTIEGTLELTATKVEENGKYVINKLETKNGIANATASLTTNEKISVVIKNEKEEIPEEKNAYALQVIKKDKEQNVTLEGADFSIQFGNEEPRMYTTDQRGIIEIPEIEIKSAGTDRIKIQEINPPYGYKADGGVIELIITKKEEDGKFKITKLDSEKTSAEVEDAYIEDQTVVIKICNTKIPYEKPDDIKPTGKYVLEILKVDRNGNTITAPATFDVNGNIVTTRRGTAKVIEFEITKDNLTEVDKYQIKETNSPEGYSKFDGTLEVEVLKGLSDDEGSYRANNVNLIVRDKDGKQLHRGDKVTYKTQNGVTTITVTVINYEKVDLALRKFITAVSTSSVFGKANYLNSREPEVDLEELDSGESTTAKYNHSKEKVYVKKGNYILYTLRTYNEGKVDAYASQVVDYLPEGLEFVTDAKENSIWDYDEETRKLTTNENYKAELLAAHEKGKELDYQDLQVVCRVSENVEEDTNIVNIAEITEAKYKDGTVVEDIDSTVDNLEYPRNLPNYNGGFDYDEDDEYIPGQEDDDDFERIFVKSIKGYYDLEIIKVDNTGKTITSSSAKFDINGNEKTTDEGSILIENVEMNKHNVDTPDTYTITETQAPKDYTKFNIPVRVDVSKKMSQDEERYEVDDVTVKIMSGEIVDSDDFEVVTENGKAKIKVYITNYPKVDLSLRKFITAVSKTTEFDEDEYFTKRIPKVNLNSLDNGTSTTADYDHEKYTMVVEKGDYILYTIRVYNEGKIKAYASEVTDYLPEGLEFVSDARENRIWNYDQDTRKLTTNNKYAAKLLAAHEKGKALDYQDLQVVCRVSENVKEDTDIVNIAEITEILHEDRTRAEDRDSTPDNVNPNNYKPNNGEDDDDYEKVLIKSIKGEYDVKIIKVDEDGKIISNLVTKFKINDEEKETEEGVISISDVEINKDNADKKDKYVITEEVAPEGYTKYDGTITLEVPKKFAKDGKSYIIDKPTVMVNDEELEQEEKVVSKEDSKNDKDEDDEDKKEEDKKEADSKKKNDVTWNVENGTIEITVVNKKIVVPDEPNNPDSPVNPDQPNNPTPQPQPTPETPSTETPKQETPQEPTPSTGDILPVVAIGIIAVVAIFNIIQMIISKRKRNK